MHTITLVAVAPGARRSVAWISVADTGDVSTGLTDPNVVIAFPGGERNGSRNPHFTFHPPIYNHLHTNGEPELLAGLMKIGTMLHDISVVPWVRLVSRPYKHLSNFSNTRRGAGFLEFPIENAKASVQVDLDFVRGSYSTEEDPRFMYANVTTEITLRLAVQSCPPSPASLTLLWQG